MVVTITEKILAKHSKSKEVSPGEIILAEVTFTLANDITAPIAISEFEKIKKPIKNCNKIVLVLDHSTPNKDIKTAKLTKGIKEFAQKYNISHYYELGDGGIEHIILPEKGLVSPGDLIIGADSHTCTYGALGAFSTGVGSTDVAVAWATGKCWFKVPPTIKFVYYGKLQKWVGGKDIILYTIGKIGVDGARYSAMEFTGEVIDNLPMDDRFTICNMAIEAGAKNGIIPPDKWTAQYLKEVGVKCNDFDYLKSDKEAKYKDIIEINVEDIEPQVAFPHLPSHTRGISEIKEIEIDQVVIGSCTNGRLSDLRIAAEILKGKKVHRNLKCLIFPGSQKVLLKALKEGLVDIFVESGAVLCPPSCGPCLGGHLGVIAEGEKCISTTNRNFVGRMGEVKSEVYLSSPAVCAASAIKGRIASPEEIL